MKKLLSILLLFASLGAFAQTYDTLPAGSKPYGNQLYLSPAGLIIGGTGSAKFRVIGTKKYVDSLLSLKYTNAQIDALLDSRAPLSGSNSYIQNQSVVSQTASFNINSGKFDDNQGVTTINGGDVFVGSKLSVPLTLGNDSSYNAASTKWTKEQLKSKASLIGGKIPTTQLPDAILGSVNYQGNYNAATNSPALPAANGNKGKYYVVNVAGTQQGLNFGLGDWIISNGSMWEKVDNNSSVTSVAGKVGVVTLNKSDVELSNVDNTSDLNKPISTATTTALGGKSNLAGGNSFTGDQSITGKVSITSPTPVGAGNALSPLVVQGAAGGDNPATTGFAQAGNASEITIFGGNGGGSVGNTSGTAFGGRGGSITLRAGSGGLATGATAFGGNAGNATLQAGTALSPGGLAGFAELKAGNADWLTGPGGNVFLTAGWGNFSSVDNPLYNGAVYLGVSNIGVVRGNTIVGANTDDRTNRFQVTGNSKLTGNMEVTGTINGSTFTGNAATASTANALGVYAWNPTPINSFDYLFGRNAANEIRPISGSDITTALGLGSAAYLSADEGISANTVVKRNASGEIILTNDWTTSIDGIYASVGGIGAMRRVTNPTFVKSWLNTSLQDVTSVGNNTNYALRLTGNAALSGNAALELYYTPGVSASITSYDRNLDQFKPLTVQAQYTNFDFGNVGIGTTAPSEKLEVSGNIKSNGLVTAISTKSANYTVTANDNTLIAETAGITFTLPDASTAPVGREYNFVNYTEGSITLTTTSGTPQFVWSNTTLTTPSTSFFSNLTFTFKAYNGKWYLVHK